MQSESIVEIPKAEEKSQEEQPQPSTATIETEKVSSEVLSVAASVESKTKSDDGPKVEIGKTEEKSQKEEPQPSTPTVESPTPPQTPVTSSQPTSPTTESLKAVHEIPATPPVGKQPKSKSGKSKK